jgi:hypothetical protein
MKSCKWIVFLLLAGSVLSPYPCAAQETATWQSAVRDSLTQKGLPDVHVFVSMDSTGLRSKADGTFRLSVRKGETVRFRKKGYKWLNVEIVDAGVTQAQVEMTPSAGSDLHGKFNEVEVNGALLPEDEWDDLNPDYIISVSVMETGDRKYKLILKTK